MGPIAEVYVVDGLPPGQEGTTTLVYAQKPRCQMSLRGVIRKIEPDCTGQRG
jgi:hypothetical protein